MNLFCDFWKNGLGFCGVYTGGGKCEKHFNKISIRKIRQKKFRGESAWQKEHGKFNNKVE